MCACSRAVPAIVAHLDVPQLLNRATPALQQSVLHHRGNLKRLFVMFRELGHLEHLGTPNYSIYTGTSSVSGDATTGNFVVPAKFENGPATIRIQLLRIGKTWKINSFSINSPVFLPRTSTTRPGPARPVGQPSIHRQQIGLTAVPSLQQGR